MSNDTAIGLPCHQISKRTAPIDPELPFVIVTFVFFLIIVFIHFCLTVSISRSCIIVALCQIIYIWLSLNLYPSNSEFLLCVLR